MSSSAHTVCVLEFSPQGRVTVAAEACYLPAISGKVVGNGVT